MKRHFYCQQTCAQRNCKRHSLGRSNMMPHENLHLHKEMKKSENDLNKSKHNFSYFKLLLRKIHHLKQTAQRRSAVLRGTGSV